MGQWRNWQTLILCQLQSLIRITPNPNQSCVGYQFNFNNRIVDEMRVAADGLSLMAMCPKGRAGSNPACSTWGAVAELADAHKNTHCTLYLHHNNVKSITCGSKDAGYRSMDEAPPCHGG
jgi:hypothetical protein